MAAEAAEKRQIMKTYQKLVAGGLIVALSAGCTFALLIIAPLAISEQRELIMSISEYSPTPKVAAKKQNALIIMELIDVESAVVTASCFAFPRLAKTKWLSTKRNIYSIWPRRRQKRGRL